MNTSLYVDGCVSARAQDGSGRKMSVLLAKPRPSLADQVGIQTGAPLTRAESVNPKTRRGGAADCV